MRPKKKKTTAVEVKLSLARHDGISDDDDDAPNRDKSSFVIKTRLPRWKRGVGCVRAMQEVEIVKRCSALLACFPILEHKR